MKSPIILLFLFLIANLTVAQSYSDIANQKTGNYSYIAKPIAGLWKVDKVSVGDNEMTPTARWFQFKPNGSYEGGNGGMRNGNGTYNYDMDTNEFWQATNGEADPYGPFKINIEGNSMTWNRFEDGMSVKVSLSRIKEKPLGTWDLIQGNWTIVRAAGLDKATDELKSEYMLDPDRYYFGWDRRYRKFDKEGNRIETGIWHIESHSNWLWTISDADNTKTGYAIAFNGNEMNWIKDGEKEKLKISFSKN